MLLALRDRFGTDPAYSDTEKQFTEIEYHHDKLEISHLHRSDGTHP